MKRSFKKIVEKVWGREDWIVNKIGAYCGKILNLKRGGCCSYHCHPKKEETFYVLCGKIGFILDGEYAELKEGDIVDIKPGQFHSFYGLEDSIMFEFSTEHSDNDVIRKTESKVEDFEKWKLNLMNGKN